MMKKLPRALGLSIGRSLVIAFKGSLRGRSNPTLLASPSTYRNAILPLFFLSASGVVTAQGVYPSHVGESPVSFETIGTPSNKFIVADSGPDNDKYTMRTDLGSSDNYDLEFELTTHNVIANRSTLVGNGLMSSKFKLYIPTYDVDYDTKDLEIQCDENSPDDEELEKVFAERNEVYFNGELIGELKGANDQWNIEENTFEIDIDKLKLPTSPGGQATNTVQIKIDVDNASLVTSAGQTGCRVWAAEIDYVAIEYEVVDPIALIVGLGRNPGTLNGSALKSDLENLGIDVRVFSYSTGINNCQGTSFFPQGNQVADEIVGWMKELGASGINIIGHSKGGLDSRVIVNRFATGADLIDTGTMDGSPVRSDIKVNSLVTLSTPHYGTVLADAMYYSWPDLVNKGISSSPFQEVCDLRVAVASTYSTNLPIPNEVNFLSIAGSIDANGNGSVDDSENTGQLFPAWMATSFYKLIRDNLRFEYQEIAEPYDLGDRVVYAFRWEYLPVAAQTPQENDSAVSVYSSLPSDSDQGITGPYNHYTVAASQNISDIVIDAGLHGILGWGVNP